MNKVDTFIVGAPKCGTTALAQLLDQNPAIQVSVPKEPHYFCSDLATGGYSAHDDADYEAHFFPQERNPGVLRVDASVWHMYSEVALARLRDYNPQARIIALLRDPARAAFSLHQQMLYQEWETEPDFVKAWAASSDRYARRSAPFGCGPDMRLLAYRHAYDFVPQIERIYEHFPSEQVMVLTQGELLRDIGKTMAKIHDHIGAEAFDYRPLTTNESRYLNSRLATAILRSRLAKQSANKLRKLLGVKSLGIHRPSARFEPRFAELVHGELKDSLATLERVYGLSLRSST